MKFTLQKNLRDEAIFQGHLGQYTLSLFTRAADALDARDAEIEKLKAEVDRLKPKSFNEMNLVQYSDGRFELRE